MGLFDKKYCDLCGEKIGLLGNRKLEDGNCCKDCAAKLSPFMTDRRSSTVEQIRDHLAYREENARRLAEITPSRILGNRMRVYIDEEKGVFFVTRYDNWQANNPDIIGIDQVTSCQFEVEEHKDELYKQDEAGKRVSYTPPRYEYEYAFRITILVSSPWFSEIEFELSDRRPDRRFSEAYRALERQANELCDALDPERRKKAELNAKLKETLLQKTLEIKKAAQEDDGWYCPECGTRNSGNFCTNCGGKRPGGKYRCDKCGWAPDDPAHPPKFCPQCGDPFTEADRT